MARRKREYPGDRFQTPPEDLARILRLGPRRSVPMASWPDDGGIARCYSWAYPWRPAPDPAVDLGADDPATWTPSDVARQIKLAMATLKRLPMAGAWPGGYRSCMPAVVRSFEESYGQDAEEERPADASAHEIALMDRALGWLSWLEARNDAVIVTGAALGASWRRVGRVVRRSHEHCRERYRRAVEVICKTLNGRVP